MNLKPVTSQQHTLENQPREWPRFYLFPSTVFIALRLTPANDPLYYTPSPALVSENPVQRFIQQRKEDLQRLVADTCKAIITSIRATIRWLFWHVIVPLAVIASLWIPFGNPSELPM
jgi:hypothetical protein